MAKNDDDLVKRYAAETAGMPPNLAKIAARNLARTDAQIGRLNVLRNPGANDLPPDVIAARYGSKTGGISPAAEPGYYDSAGKFLGPLSGSMPKGATGIVGRAAASPTTTPATARQIGFYGDTRAISAKPAAQRTAYEKSFLSGYDIPSVATPAPTLGYQAGRLVSGAPSFIGRGGFALPGLLGSGVSAVQSFFPAIRSFFSSRPRPFNPTPPLNNVAVPSPTPSPTPGNPYYADMQGM